MQSAAIQSTLMRRALYIWGIAATLSFVPVWMAHTGEAWLAVFVAVGAALPAAAVGAAVLYAKRNAPGHGMRAAIVAVAVITALQWLGHFYPSPR